MTLTTNTKFAVTPEDIADISTRCQNSITSIYANTGLQYKTGKTSPVIGADCLVMCKGVGQLTYSPKSETVFFPYGSRSINGMYEVNIECDGFEIYDEHHTKYQSPLKHMIKNVIFSGPCTIVLWNDGTKTIVRCENEDFDEEKGLAMAIAKKALGNKGNYYDIFKKWLTVEEEDDD